MTNRIAKFLTDWPGDEPPKIVNATPAAPVEASGSGWAEMVVHADAYAKGPTRSTSGPVQVSLERTMDTGMTWLSVDCSGALGDANGEQRGTQLIQLRSPEALRALVEACLQLMADQTGKWVLENITGDPDPPESEHRENLSRDDDDDDGEGWKAATT